MTQGVGKRPSVVVLGFFVVFFFFVFVKIILIQIPRGLLKTEPVPISFRK